MNWKERIDQATIKDKFTHDDMVNAKQWNTCSIGEKLNSQSNIYHYNLKKTALQLGVEFSKAILNHDTATATKTHKQIQALKISNILKEKK